MSSTDWLTPVLTTTTTVFSFLYLAISTAFRYTILYIPGILYNVLYYVSIPLTYPLYYVGRILAFVLSPVAVVFRGVNGLAAWVVGAVIKLRYLYVYFAIAGLIGIASACLLHGTSTVVFLLLGISHDKQQQQEQRIKPRPALPSRPASYEYPNAKLRRTAVDEYDDDDDDDAQEEKDDQIADGSDPIPNELFDDPPLELHQGDRPIGTPALWEAQWRRAKSTRMAPLPPSRRSRTLLAQSILEESSESETA